MNEREAYAKVKSIADDTHAKGHNFVRLVVTRKRGASFGDRVRVMPGVMGEFLCANEEGDKVRAVVSVKLAALDNWLDKHREWA
jgi:hypothetical protein